MEHMMSAYASGVGYNAARSLIVSSPERTRRFSLSSLHVAGEEWGDSQARNYRGWRARRAHMVILHTSNTSALFFMSIMSAEYAERRAEARRMQSA